MSGLLGRVLDDAALCPPRGAPVGAVLPAYREAARDPVVGRLRCPASRFPEVRARLVPEDFLDVVLVADTGVEELPDVVEGVGAEPRVRLSAVEIGLPGGADQARATAVVLARLPDGPPADIVVRREPGRREALDRIAAARGRGAEIGAHYRTDGTSEDAVGFVRDCVDRGVPFTIAASPGVLSLLLGTHRRAGGLSREAVRRWLVAVSVPDLGAAKDELALIREDAISPSGR
jgi:hypothetical protein